MELGDIPVLETGAAMHTGSTPVIGTLPLSSKDRTSGYEPDNTRSIRVAETKYDLMDKARRHELKMLHYKKRMKKMRQVYPDGNYFAYRSHSTPCSCGCCRGDKYSRAKEMKRARKLAEPINEHGSL